MCRHRLHTLSRNPVSSLGFLFCTCHASDMEITVISARVVNGHVGALVRADYPPRAQIRLQLEFSIGGPIDIWATARDEALSYLDLT